MRGLVGVEVELQVGSRWHLHQALAMICYVSIQALQLLNFGWILLLEDGDKMALFGCCVNLMNQSCCL